MKKICIFGGSFDPPHKGHVYAAEKLIEVVDVDRFYVIPCFLSPFKAAKNASDDHRLNMVKAAFKNIKNVYVSDYEIKKEGFSYTCDTVRHFKEIFPDDIFYLLTGADAYVTLEKWKDFEYLAKNCVFAVINRASDEKVTEKQEIFKNLYGAKTLFIDVPQMDVSSTAIRKAIAAHESFREFLPEDVADYIERYGLYSDPESEVNEKLYDTQKIIKDLKLSERRFRHTLGTEKAALELAKYHFPELDMKSVSAAALLHDATKELTYEEHLAIFAKYGIETPGGGEAAKKFFHAKTAAALAKHVYGLPDEAVSAISYHTTGKGNMTPFEKVIYFADYIEENRDDEVCCDVRDHYLKLRDKYPPEISIDMALLYALDKTIKLLIKEKKFIHSDTVDARNDLIMSLKDPE